MREQGRFWVGGGNSRSAVSSYSVMRILRDWSRFFRRYRLLERRTAVRERRRFHKRRSEERAVIHRFVLLAAFSIMFVIAVRGLDRERKRKGPHRRHHDARGIKRVATPLPRQAMRPPQFGNTAEQKMMHGNEAVGVSAPAPAAVVEGDGSLAQEGYLNSSNLVVPQSMFSRRCFGSSVTDDAVCVHRPFCARHTGIVYLADSLECGQGISAAQCVTIERMFESAGEIAGVEIKPRSWLESLLRDEHVQWYEGSSVFIRLGPRCTSVVQFAHRVLMLHHVLRHAHMYGAVRLANVVIVADEVVAKKIRFRRSWHHWLLAAVVHPHKLIFSHSAASRLVSSSPPPPDVLRVFVPSGMNNFARGKLVPCFRHAILPGGFRSNFFLNVKAYPAATGVPLSDTHSAEGSDALPFRRKAYAAVGIHIAAVSRRIVYLHRTRTRTLTEQGSALLDRVLKTAAQASGFSYEFLDIEGLQFGKVLNAVGNAGVVVGVHGTQMLSTLFLGKGTAIVEVFPYQFSNQLYGRYQGDGRNILYQSHSVARGSDFTDISKFPSLEACLAHSAQCRRWYRSDDREVQFVDVDAARMAVLVARATRHVDQHIHV